MSELGKSILRGSIGLGLFAMITAGLIAVTQNTTAPAIEQAIAEARSRALLAVLPGDLQDQNLLEQQITLPGDTAELGVASGAEAYRFLEGGRVAGVILPWSSSEGYTGPIDGILSIDRQGRVLGVRVVRHKETPGLGDKIEKRKSDWVDQFAGRSLQDPLAENWAVRKDGGAFDQLTGATVTPRAVVGSLKGALQYYAANQAALLGAPEADNGETP